MTNIDNATNNNCKRGKLFVVSGPSGVGKGTVCEIVHRECPCVLKSVSVTTRAPRSGEKEGVNYYYRTKEQYFQIKQDNGFLETFEIYGNYYGTPKAHVVEKLSQGYSMLLEIDVQGAMRVKQQMPEAILIFLEPPSIEVLKQRLMGRNSEDEQSLARRLNSAKLEIEQKHGYDYIVVNDTVEQAAGEVIEIINASISQ